MHGVSLGFTGDNGSASLAGDEPTSPSKFVIGGNNCSSADMQGTGKATLRRQSSTHLDPSGADQFIEGARQREIQRTRLASQSGKCARNRFLIHFPHSSHGLAEPADSPSWP